MRILPFLFQFLIVVVALDAALAPSTVCAQAHRTDAGTLEEVIEAQERRLDQQQRKLEQLKQQVEALKTSSTLDGEVLSPEQLTELEYFLNESSTAARDDWPGSIDLPGSDTRIKLGGFVELDVIYDDGAIGTPTDFVTSAIVTDRGTPQEGANGETNFSIQPTRLTVETRTPVGRHLFTSFVSLDLFGDGSSASPDFHFRQGYGEISEVLFGGDLLFGQAWSTFTYLASRPNTLDFEGPSANAGFRRPMLRWAKVLRPCLKLTLGIEAPDGRVLQNADSVSEWPDGAAAVSWETDIVHLNLALVSRDLRASGDSNTTVSDTGWGASVGGRIHMRGPGDQDFLSFSYTRGDGIGGMMNDGPPDAVYDPGSNRLRLIPLLGVVLGYQHYWTPDLYTVISYSMLEQDNRKIQSPDSFRRTKYGSANLVWAPFANWLFGFEILNGSRLDKDGSSSDVNRFQFTSRLTF